MKKVILLLLLLTPIILNSQEFRNTLWGTSAEEVKQKEISEKVIHDSADKLVYEAQLKGRNVIVIYNFENDKLYRGFYIYYCESDCLETFYDFNNTLEIKYGTPIQNERIVDLEYFRKKSKNDYKSMIKIKTDFGAKGYDVTQDYQPNKGGQIGRRFYLDYLEDYQESLKKAQSSSNTTDQEIIDYMDDSSLGQNFGFFTTWKTKKTDINLLLGKANNNEKSVRISYEDNSYLNDF